MDTVASSSDLVADVGSALSRPASSNVVRLPFDPICSFVRRLTFLSPCLISHSWRLDCTIYLQASTLRSRMHACMHAISFDSELTNSPNLRVVSAFFIGFVFWESLCDLIRSPFTLYVSRRILHRFSGGRMLRPSGEALGTQQDKEVQVQSSANGAVRRLGLGKETNSMSGTDIFRRKDNPILIFVMTLLFFLGSTSRFVSTLSFTIKLDDKDVSSRDQGLCAFLIAWDSTCFQTARVVGLVVLGLNLGSLGAKRIESLILWLTVTVISILIIVSNAFGIGAFKVLDFREGTVDVHDGKAISLCLRRHNLASSLTLSFIAMGAEVYCISIFQSIIAPSSFPTRRRLGALFRDIRIIRSFSLLAFDLTVLAPNAIATGYLGDSLPFSIASLIVLVVFNRYHPSDPLFHEAPSSGSFPPQRRPDRSPSIRYGTLILPHPYSAAALAASGNWPDVRRAEDYSGITTTSGSNHALLGRGVRLDTYNLQRDRISERPDVPPVPPEKSERDMMLGSLARRRPTVTSRRTQKSQQTQLVRPILPKSELARRFNDSEQSPASSSEEGRVLAPRPTGKARAPRMQAPPPSIVQSTTQTTRRSHAASTSRTLASESVRYGSDILRPEPGRPVRDKMRTTREERAPSPTSSRTHVTTGTSVMMHPPLKHASIDSWLSDRTVDANNFARRASPNPVPTTFNGGWPLPPLPIAADSYRECPAHQINAATVERAAFASETNTDRAVRSEKLVVRKQRDADARGIRQPWPVRGPRMEPPPPRSRVDR